MKKILKVLFIISFIFILCSCGSVKLKDKEESIIEFKNGSISSNDFYEILKERYAEDIIVNIIDKYLLDEMYKTTSEEKKFINEQIKNAKISAESNNISFEQFLDYYYRIPNEDALKDNLSLNYKRMLWIEDYAKETVTNKQIKEYYETEIHGDMDVSHILITAEVNDEMNDEEKTKAKEDALNKAKEVINKLNKGEDFSILAKEYSSDTANKDDAGKLEAITYKDYNNYDQSFIMSAKDLEVGKYTNSPVESQYGYHIILKTNEGEKPELNDEVKEVIREYVGKEISSQSEFYPRALLALREQNKMKFKDKQIEKYYNNNIN